MPRIFIYLTSFARPLLVNIVPAAADPRYVKIGSDWTYVANPMLYKLEICLENAPAGADQMIKKAAATWSYAKFKFSFDANESS